MKLKLHSLISLENDAKKHENNKEYKKAIKKHKKMLEKIESPDIHLEIVKLYFEILIKEEKQDKEIYLQIIHHLNQAFSLNPKLEKYQDLLLDYAYVHLKLGYLEQAREIIKKVLEIDDVSNFESILHLLGYIEFLKMKQL